VREEPSNPAADAFIARIAARQHGVVSLDQLRRAGISRQSLTRRGQANRLHRIHRGVYAVGHRGLSEMGGWMAAVLACGPGAVLSHTSAGRLWGIIRSIGPPSSADVGRFIAHVTVPDQARSRQGIKVHRSRTLRGQTTRRAGIPVTTPSRTLVDLRRILSQPQFSQALRQAEYLGLPVEDLDPDHTRSELEARFLALCRRHRLPEPEVNPRVGPFTVDFLWRDARLIVEVDGFRAHGTRAAFESDRERDAHLTALGFSVIRLTWRQLTATPRDVIAKIRRILGARAA
jgi:very-short-patch-repair endonuclease